MSWGNFPNSQLKVPELILKTLHNNNNNNNNSIKPYIKIMRAEHHIINKRGIEKPQSKEQPSTYKTEASPLLFEWRNLPREQSFDLGL
jgi:hypothetical protein